jgi:hypothetical protein
MVKTLRRIQQRPFGPSKRCSLYMGNSSHAYGLHAGLSTSQTETPRFQNGCCRHGIFSLFFSILWQVLDLYPVRGRGIPVRVCAVKPKDLASSLTSSKA